MIVALRRAWVPPLAQAALSVPYRAVTRHGRRYGLSALHIMAVAANVCLVNVQSGPQYQSLGNHLLANKHAYCNACGYRCLLHTKRLSERPPAWDKIRALQAAFASGCSLCIWVDADVILRRAFDATPFAVADIVAMQDFNGLNTGVMLLRRSATVDELLHRTWNATQFTNAVWWEQRALRYVLDQTDSQHLLAATKLHTELVAYMYKTDEGAPVFHASGCELPSP